MGQCPAWRLAPHQLESVTIMDRFPAEVQVEVPMSYAPGRKAALASSRAKACVLVICILLGARFYAVEEKKNAAGAAQALPRQVQDLGLHFAAGSDDPASIRIRQVFYDKQEGVYCGEVNSRNVRGGDARFKDGVRIFVCGPGVPEHVAPPGVPDRAAPPGVPDQAAPPGVPDHVAAR
jgi:hypothetical protein